MQDKIKQILSNNKNIAGYKIKENKTESCELFLIGKNADMDRAKSVHHFKVTVYRDMEEGGNRYRGSSTANIHPTMSYSEIEKALNDAAFAAQFVKNPYYPLAKAEVPYKVMGVSSFSKESLSFWMNEIIKAIYKNDKYEKGGINSCEVFLNKVYTHIINSEGIDIDSTNYECMVEFITTWKENNEEVELYDCLNFSELDSQWLSEEIETMITICREKAVAKNTPALGKASVLLTRDAVKDFLFFYYTKCSADAVYRGASTWKAGECVQGENVKGDLITMHLNPFMKNSTNSRSFDDEGFPLEAVTILDKGILKEYISDTRYAHYLNVEPTGLIKNAVVCGGRKSIDELKNEPYLEALAFSDFRVDPLTGYFCGEIRLARYFDGEKITPVTGGSISGNINELQDELYLSKELQKDNDFEGPRVIKLLNATIAGVE